MLEVTNAEMAVFLAQTAADVSASLEETAASVAEQTPQVAEIVSKKIESGAKEVEKQVRCSLATTITSHCSPGLSSSSRMENKTVYATKTLLKQAREYLQSNFTENLYHLKAIRRENRPQIHHGCGLKPVQVSPRICLRSHVLCQPVCSRTGRQTGSSCGNEAPELRSRLGC